MQLSYSGLTHQGRVRAENQDSIYLPQEECSLPCLFLVADGMGGANGGKTASDLAIRIVPDIFFRNLARQGPEKAMRKAVHAANEAIYNQAQAAPHLRGMGTTLVGLLILPDKRALIVNLGDSRCYLLREGELHQISEDHTVVQEMVRQGTMTEEQARQNGMRNMLSKALGVTAATHADIFAVKAVALNDLFLLCSDGLHGPVPDAQLHAVLRQPMDISTKTQQLIQRANANGGPDNISAVLVRINQDAYQPEADEITYRKKIPQNEDATVVSSAFSGILGRILGK